MTTIIIRDDDICFFTPRNVLSKVYGPCWERSIPVSMGVIPSVLSQKCYRESNHPFIPASATGEQRHYSLDRNAELCGFLEQHAQHNNIEICMHGFDHRLENGVPEFGSNDRAALIEKIDGGIDLFRRIFPNTKVRTFIPPFNTLSRAASRCLTGRDWHIATAGNPLPWFLNLRSLFTVAKDRFFDAPTTTVLPRASSTIFISPDMPHRGTTANPAASYDRIIHELEHQQHSGSVFVVLHHYWNFFEKDSCRETPLLASWHRFLEKLSSFGSQASFTSFAALAQERVRNVKSSSGMSSNGIDRNILKL